MRATLTHLIFPKRGGELAHPHGLSLPDGATLGTTDHPSGWNAETQTLHYTHPDPANTEEAPLPPVEASHTFAPAEIDAAFDAALTPLDISELPLRERLKSVTGGFPAALKAAFPFERVAYWLDQGDAAAAKAVIEAVDVSSFPQDVQDAHSALLAQFD